MRRADAWSTAKAAEMKADGYADGVIIRYIEAYGVGFEVARGLVLALRQPAPNKKEAPAPGASCQSSSGSSDG